MKKIILGLMLLMVAPAGAAEQPTAEEFQAMNCTQAVEWLMAGIQSLKPPWGRPMPDTEAATLAIKMLARPTDSPCNRGNLMPQGKK